MFHASNDHRDLLSRCENGRVSTRLVAFLLVLVALPDFARAGEEIETKVLDAYATGLNRQQRGNTQKTLSVRRFGNTRMLIGKDPSGKPVTELVCLLCTDDELISEARSVGARTAASAKGAQAALIQVDHRDIRDRVYVDGIPLAPVGGQHPIEAGDHEITEVREDSVRTTMISLPPEGHLVLSGDASREPEDPTRLKRVRAAAMTCGIGLATATLGGLFMWLDGQCTSPDCSLLHHMGSPGIGLLVSGVLVQGVVVWLFVTGLKHRKGESK